VEKFFREYEAPDFPKAGNKAAYTVYLEKGTRSLEGYSHALEPYLRKLGLPTKLTKQKIELLADTYVCREGDELNVEQCKILKLLGHEMAKFKLVPKARRDHKGNFHEYS